jgi:hypothetical protein
VDLLHGLNFEFLVLGDHDAFEGEEVVAEEDLLEDLGVALAADALDDALFQDPLGNSDFLDHGFEEEGGEAGELLEDLGVLELVLLGVVETDAVLLDEVQEGIAPDGRDQVLPHVVVDPLFVLAQLILLLLDGLLLLLRPEQPLQHIILI